MKGLNIFLIILIFSHSIGVLAEDDHDHDHDHGDCHSKEDHNDDHTGYFETIRINNIKPGKTQENVISAVNEYLEVVEERDDLVEFMGFFDETTQKYITAGTWRTASGASTSFTEGTSSSSYLDVLEQTEFYSGVVTNFQSEMEIHSASERNYWKTVRIGELVTPNEWNSTNLPTLIHEGLIEGILAPPGSSPLNGFIDYATAYPETPVANKYWVTQATWNDKASATNAQSEISKWLEENLDDKITTLNTYSGVIVNFYHSEPETCSSNGSLVGPSLLLLVVFYVLSFVY